MHTPIFKGAAVALVTPMNQDGTVNYDKLTELIEFQIKGGTDAIVACGTTGEASTLTHEEHINVIRHTVEKVNGRVPVIAGTGSNSTETAIYLSKEAEKAGADALLLVTPYYNKATQKGLVEHFVKTAEAVKIPAILYNVPSRTGCNILPATVKEIARRASNVVAIKEASGNISQVAELASIMDENFAIYSGNDDQIVPLLSLGGIGVISVLSNIAPRETHDIVASYLEGDVKKSARLQLEAIDLIKSLFIEVNPIPVKTALNLMGMNAGPLRLPLTEMDGANVEKLKKSLADYGISVKANQVLCANDL
ncbi:MAG: 4-hydroxy-tetrahydrodipicolinate synthase, partial [Lachnospiraceae bacterium]|nr:4-hydroxy-tetrahydrodipicolinate synthase [Lachnospiraceae bacterium]